MKATIGSLIRTARLSRGLSQNDMETISGIPKPRLSRYENNRVVPTIQTVEVLAKALGVSPSQLVGWR